MIEKYIPWNGFGQRFDNNDLLVIDQLKSKNTAKRYIKEFRHLKPQQQLIISASVPVMLGKDFKTPSEVLFTYHTEKRQLSHPIQLAKKLAASYQVRVYNLADNAHLNRIQRWLTH